MDKQTRNLIQEATQDARNLLDSEFGAQLEGVFDILPDGHIAPSPGEHLNAEQRVIRQKVVAAIEHERAAGVSNAEAVARYLRETSFTYLNRFVALKMLEGRGLVQKCVSQGEQSSGFKEFCGLAPGLGDFPDKGYRLYIESLFDELSTEIRVLFDRKDMASLLWPGLKALEGLLSILNREETSNIWGEDETIGWVYQYFNSPDERKKMREESASPRNSRELAVRNQFFTPRYVVQFLTDNTLGRIWYEMRKGDSALKDRCRYLVRRPMEIFLGDPVEAYKRLWGLPEDGEIEVPHVVAEAFRGDLSHLPKEVGPEVYWISLAIPPDQFEKYTGVQWQPFDSGPLDGLLEHGKAPMNPKYANDVTRIWMALCHFRLTDSGSPYGSEPFKTLWNAFKEAVNHEQEKESDKSQEELLSQPVYIPHRTKKDPRDIRILDPACGSGHFLLYAFDLLLDIYEEGWGDPDAPKSESTGKSLREDYPEKDRLMAALPSQILRQNLHGIDIDARAVQIAALSLWMRAQKAYAAFNITRANRLTIKKTKIVTAEPMPGEEDMRREFTSGLKPRVLGQLVDVVFEKMKLAGEAGSLLKIEEEIKDAVAEAKRQWLEGPKPEQQLLFFPGMTDLRPKQQELRFDVKLINDERFWGQAEDRILDALKDYAERPENGHAIRRRLFADDAARGFAFIDLCRKRYDVVLMNPPFGEAPSNVESELKSLYFAVPNDLYCQFVDRAVTMLNDGTGLVGAITNSSFILYTDFEPYRKYLFVNRFTPLLADLGAGVLDAYVAAACYVVGQANLPSNGIWACDARSHQQKNELLLNSISEANKAHLTESSSFRMYKTYTLIEGSPICHWAPDSLWKLVKGSDLLGNHLQEIGVGAAPVSDFFVGRWEVPSSRIGFGKRWVTICNGGYFSPFYRDDYRVVDWNKDGVRAKADLCVRYPYLKGNVGLRIQRTAWFGKRGITYGKRTDRFTAQPLPEGSIFTFEGIGVFPADDHQMEIVLGYLNTRFVAYFLNLSCGLHKNDIYVRRLPWVDLPSEKVETVIGLTQGLVSIQRQAHSVSEMSTLFITIALLLCRSDSLRTSYVLWREQERRQELDFIKKRHDLDSVFEAELGVDEKLRIEIAADQGQDCFRFHKITGLTKEQIRKALKEKPGRYRPNITRNFGKEGTELTRASSNLLINPETIANIMGEAGLYDPDEFVEETKALLSWIIGSMFSRWDVRIALNPSLAPKLTNPFDPLPVCPPGMLVGPDGLPAEPGRIVSGEWLRKRADGGMQYADGKWMIREGDDSLTAAHCLLPSDADYPLRVSWDGILVGDPGFDGAQPHREDIVRRVREMLDVLWKDKSLEIEQEGCDILGVSDLRAYFRKDFFSDHIKRYSKSRRKAPIYWQLSTPSAAYSVWLYYHRFTKDTMYQVLNEFVAPKLKFEERELANARQGYGPSPTASQRKEIAAREAFVAELKTFRDEVARVAPLWNPNLDDGVIINFAPLWRLVTQNRSWQKECKQVWDKLVKGDYDWAHLAMHLWPERVVPKCAKDRSLAIAHALEEVFWEEDKNGKWVPKKVPKEAVEVLVKERSSPTVKAALEELLKAPVSNGTGRKGKKKA